MDFTELFQEMATYSNSITLLSLRHVMAIKTIHDRTEDFRNRVNEIFSQAGDGQTIHEEVNVAITIKERMEMQELIRLFLASVEKELDEGQKGSIQPDPIPNPNYPETASDI